jgi:hypothetical protein
MAFETFGIRRYRARPEERSPLSRCRPIELHSCRFYLRRPHGHGHLAIRRQRGRQFGPRVPDTAHLTEESGKVMMAVAGKWTHAAEIGKSKCLLVVSLGLGGVQECVLDFKIPKQL